MRLRHFSFMMVLGRFLLVAALVTAFAPAMLAGEPAAGQPFAAFVRELWPEAEAQGISRQTFDAAFAGVQPDGRVLAATRRAPEYGKPFGDYISSIVTQSRIDIGRRKLAQWTDALRTIEARYGVDRALIVSIWGIESSFGEAKDRWDVIRSIATLAHARFQHPYFRNELISALKILQQGHVARGNFLGSWAGAMGQAQFMPSSFFAYAVDFDGDGRRDIWSSVPDVLASIANYVQKSGWQSALPWGFEVVLPAGFDYRLSHGALGDWAARGLRRADGKALPQSGEAILFFPSGAGGPAFLVTENFNVIKRFNNSDAYALAVAHLADRIAGGGPIRTAWPANDDQPSRDQRIALQRKLADLGYKVRNFTGHFDFDLRDAVREEQHKLAMVPDGHPSRAFLERLGVRAP